MHRLLLLIPLLIAGPAYAQPEPDVQAGGGRPLPPLPEATPSAKLWARWWWMGSAVTETGLTAHLEAFREAGLGGAGIVPIYGVKGYEDDFIPYLSDEWRQMLAHTLDEAGRLGLEIDMTLGTGWPYGGPWITEAHAAKRYDPATGEVVGTGQQVKRASPGAEGPVVDPFDADALDAFLAPYNEVFAQPDVRKLRAVFNDSYEVYGADWTPRLLEAFAARRGYDLTPYLPELFIDSLATDTLARVRSDYQETLSELLLERFAEPWAAWSHDHGALARYQAHGSPGNLLDLYAAADIPETESFGPSRFPIPGVRADTAYSDEQFGNPSPLVMKFASSAAHVAGRPLASAEAATWLGEHFRVALSQVKPEVDLLFTSGINHVFLHGIPYSPAEAPWPGWLFYASTHFGPSSTLWTGLPDLAGYVARVQALLQTSAPDPDVLLYFPIYDLWQTPPGDETDEGSLPRQLSVHNPAAWLFGTPFGDLAEELEARGYAVDFVSDRQLQAMGVGQDRRVRLTQEAEGTSGAAYRAVVVPPAQAMPLATLQALQRLADRGADVVFVDSLPADVPGLHDLVARRLEAQVLEQAMRSAQIASVVPRAELEAALEEAGVRREPLADEGLRYARRRDTTGTLYFIANLDRQFEEGWIELATEAASVELYDPLTGRRGLTQAVEQAGEDTTRLYLQLRPGESVIVRTYDEPRNGPAWHYDVPTDQALRLSGPWQLTFLEGGPALPDSITVDAPGSWTVLGDSLYQDFGGTVRYTHRFTLSTPFSPDSTYLLDLGDVREHARVRLNGQDLGAAWSVPFEVRVPPDVLQEENVLEIDVTNLAANRIAALDRSGTPWKTFYDINFVSVTYEPFDASGWAPAPSGLLGPVVLRAVTQVRVPPSHSSP